MDLRIYNILQNLLSLKISPFYKTFMLQNFVALQYSSIVQHDITTVHAVTMELLVTMLPHQQAGWVTLLRINFLKVV